MHNNTFHNEEWYDCHRSNIGGKCGNRNVILNTSYPENNIFYENQLYAIYYYYVNKNDMIVENNWEEAGDPKFIDLTGQADPFDFTVFDFRLQPDSPCKDNGGFLTRTKNSGNNSTEVKVEDAGYFIDGFGITNGDGIQFEGQTQKARIVSIDYSTNTLHLESTMSWASGVGVSLPYSGSRPDQGVYEYSDSVCLADLEPDGDVDEDDLNTLAAGFGKTSVAKDTDGDGDMDGADLSEMAVDFDRTDCFP